MFPENLKPNPPPGKPLLVTYQAYLKDNFTRRLRMNPRYSLRAYAKLLDLSPSKLSEILAGKKGLGPERAEKVCDKLKLAGVDREIFLLSVSSQHSRLKNERVDAKAKLKELVAARRVEGERTTQRNAWYFGAVKTTKESGLDPERLARPAGLTSLQIENADRYHQRSARFHPHRRVISYEPMSVVKKIGDDFASGALDSIEAEFAFLTREQAQSLVEILRARISEFAKEAKDERTQNLNLFFIGHSTICSKEDLC